jgi:hypothetical protein
VSRSPAETGPRGQGTAAITVVGALALGVALGLLPSRWDVVVGLVTVVLIVAVTTSLLRGPAPKRPPRPPLTARQGLALGSMYLVLANTLTFRIRPTDDLSSNPLDLAGSFRLSCLAGAVGLACASMVLDRVTTRLVPRPAWCIVGYTLVIPLGALGAVSPALVLFKWSEIVVFLLVWFALVNAFRGDPTVPLRHLGFWIGGLVAVVVAGVLLQPDLALKPADSLLPVQVQGALLPFSANDVGALGLLLLAYGLGRSRVNAGLVAGGAALLIGAQFRTGYIAALGMVVLFLLLRRQAAARVVLIALAVLLPLAVTTSTFEEAWVRGDSSGSITTLTGRTIWWGAGIEATERSRLVGLGLTSGVRYEVFADEADRELTSAIHSTWVEAYVGTGLLGAALLLAAMVSAWLAAWRRARWDGYLFPALVMTMLVIRSITASTIDLGGITLMLFLLCVSAAAQRPSRPVEDHGLPLPIPVPVGHERVAQRTEPDHDPAGPDVEADQGPDATSSS